MIYIYRYLFDTYDMFIFVAEMHMIAALTFLEPRNFDQTWRVLYHYGKQVSRKRDRSCFEDMHKVSGSGIKQRLRGKTKPFKRVVKQPSTQKRKRTRGDRNQAGEDFRADPIANVIWFSIYI